MPDRQFADPRLADLYDLGNAGSDDRDYYLSLAGSPPKTILDLGCGTGLLSLMFAERGHEVVGVDPASAMLDVARRAANSDVVEWIESAAEDFTTSRRFDLIIMTGHAFQVLLQDDQISAVLRLMATHLKPGGRVAFESRNPNMDWDAIWAREYVMQTNEGPVRAVRRMTETSKAPDYLSFAWDYHFVDEVITSESTLRFLACSEIITFAERAGLSLQSVQGDWDGSVFEPDQSQEMIFQFRL